MKETDSVYEFGTNVSSNYLTVNNSILLLTIVGSLIFTYCVFLLAYRLSKNLNQFFLPLLISYIVLAFPAFCSFNLWGIEWIPKLPTENIFSDFYFNQGQFLISLSKLFCIAIFIAHFYKNDKLSSFHKKGLFIPLYNLIIIGKVLYQQSKTSLSKAASFIFLFAVTVDLFYKIIAPLLFLIDINSFGWYVDLIYGKSPEYLEIGYTYITDIIMLFNATTPFIVALATIPIYFIMNRLSFEEKND